MEGIIGINTLIKRPQRALLPFLPCEVTGRKQGSVRTKILTRHRTCKHHGFGFPSLQEYEKLMFVLHKTPSL